MASGGWVDLQQSAPYQIAIGDLNYADADNDPIVSLTVQTLPSHGALELYGYAIYPGQEIFASDILFGNFSYRPASNVGASYSTSFSFSVSDGWHSSANTASLGFQVEVTPNSPPAITGSNHSLNSPQTHTLNQAALGYSDSDGDSLQSITIHSTPASGTLQYYGYPVTNGQTFYSYEIDWGYLTYVPNSSANATYQDSFTFKANDGFGDSLPATIAYTVNVTPNSPPVVTGGALALQATRSRTLTIADLGYSDPDGDSLQSITIHSTPASGTLQYYGSPVSSGQTFSSYDIEWGYLTYVPNPSANATYQDSITFTANDGFGDSLPATIAYTINVTPNSPPTVSGSSSSLTASDTRTISLGNLGYSDPDGDSLRSITIAGTPYYGFLEYDGYPIYGGQWLSASDIASGYLTYRPDPNHGSAFLDSFTFTANDGHSDSVPATIHFNVTATRSRPQGIP